VFIHDGIGNVLVGDRLKKTVVEGVSEVAIPGGKIDWMERAIPAAVREAMEETGLEIEVERQIGYSDDIWTHLDTHCLTLFFQARVIGGELTVREPDKFANLRWVRPADIKILFADAHLLLPGLRLESGQQP
jgi:ADP-ribose pyrophosphatase YjhB (NUDIX family)